ncbi:MAG TPA: HAD-IC family P-type ATPase, partial [Dehalococcoidia bacterium]|nr:HAD-IC family P-type ATPase [Dehalococcoidia bacterium]
MAPEAQQGEAGAAPLTPWHALDAGQVLERLATSPQGLSSDEAARRLRQFGPNRLKAAPPASTLLLLLEEFRSPLVLVLIAAALLLFLVAALGNQPEQNVDAALILAIVLVNGGLGFVQNYRAQRGIEALQRLSAPVAAFLRDGRLRSDAASLLVPGDVALLEEGDRVPADGRLTETYDLRLDESALTGESLPVSKGSGPVPAGTALADRRNMVYLGTTVMRGRGRLVVTGTGMATEVGKIAADIQSAPDPPTPFQRQVAELGRRITVAVALLVLVIALVQFFLRHLSLLETFVTAVALAVAAIPEGLPVVLTLALALGTRRMLERRCLVRSLPVVEMVGSAQIICSDKTGTITEGRMSLRSLYWQGRFLEVTGGAASTQGEFLDGGRPTDQRHNLALLAGGLCNNAQLGGDGTFQGDPTEVALLVAAHKAGVDLAASRRVDELPFASERKMMSVVVQRSGERLVFAKGATEVILQHCTRMATSEGSVPMSDGERTRLLEVNGQLAGQALRVMALAYKEGLPSSRDQTEQELVFLGLAGL